MYYEEGAQYERDILMDLIYYILTEDFYLGVAMSSNIIDAIRTKLREGRK